MSYNNNIEIEAIDDSINWVENAISEKHIKYYEYEHFSNIKEIGSDGIGKFYRANWKNSNKHLALKSFFNFNNLTIKEIVHEIKLHREVDFHDNIIHFYGVTTSNQENQNDQLKNYLLVMEYADGGTLRNYLKENFVNLTWNDKFNLALQLACAVSCLHNEGIIHRDLHSNSILVHQNVIKLADLGLLKRIEEASKSQSKLFGIIPYVDPKRFSRQKSKNKPQLYSLNEKSDVYSIGMLLWEISSGKLPFYIEGEPYDIDLALEISQGLRETVVLDTPTDYANLYTECWDMDLDNRPTMNQVVERLKSMISITNQLTIGCHNCNANLDKQFRSSFNNLLNGELSQIIQNFDKISAKEVFESLILLEKKVDIIVNEIVVDIILKNLRMGKLRVVVKQLVLDYLNNNGINSQGTYDWLLNNQNNSNSIFLLGYFNHFGIIISNENYEKAFNLFINASKQNHSLAQYFVGRCYEFGNGTAMNEKLALEYYKKIANKDCKDCALGEFKIGRFYQNGLVVEEDSSFAVYWYKKAANNGNSRAMIDLALMYKNGKGVEEDHNKAFELFKKAANLENRVGQYRLALMYEDGDGAMQDIDQAIYWYKKSAEQGYQDAQNKLEKLSKK